MSVFRQIYCLYPAHLKKRFWWLFSGMLLLALVETATVGVIAFYAAAVSDPRSTHQLLTTQQFLVFDLSSFFEGLTVKNMIAGLSILVIVVVIAKNALSGFVTLHIARFSALLESYFGERMLEGFLYRDCLWHLQRNSADLIQKINWRQYVGRNFTTPHLKMMTEVIMLLVLLCGLLVVQPIVSLLFIATQGIGGFFVYRMLRGGLDASARGCREAEVILNRNATHALHGVKDVKISGTERYFIEGFGEWASRFAFLFGRQQFWRESPLLALESLGFVIISGAILFMLFGLGYSPLETTGTTALLAVTAWRTLPAFNRVVSSLADIRAAIPYVEPFLEELSEQKDIRKTEEPQQTAEIFTEKIEFKGVWFGYDEARPVLQEFNLTIPRGGSIGIMGPSGCGKSTFVDLLTGLLTPKQGQILIDGISLSKDNLPSWLKCIGYVPQFPYVFDGTLAENVAFGQSFETIDRERILTVCRMAAIDFLSQLPHGVDSVIGERGVKLSGGQRQRVAIARALYRNPSLIIFDEATSALDEEKDAEIRQLILALKGQQTLVVVSHRPSTVTDCDVIVRMAG